MSVHAAVVQELAKLRDVAPDLADGAFAATALALALEIDAPDNSATSKSMCAGQLREVLKELHALTPPAEEEDDLAKLRADRAARLDARAGVAAP